MKAKTKPGSSLKLIPVQQSNLQEGRTYFAVDGEQEVKLTGNMVGGHYEVIGYIWQGSIEPIERTCNDEGVALIKHWEGLKLNAYRCSAKVPTIGYGTTRINGNPVQMGMRITEEQAEEYLRNDLRKFEQSVSDRTDGIPLTDNQFSALVSLCYNCGMAPLNDNATIKRALNARAYKTAAEGFMLWVKADGKTLQGLVNRRREEKALFEKHD